MGPNLLYGLLYLEINLLASLLVIFICHKTLGISKMVSQRNFSHAITAEIIFFLSDTAAVLISCGILPLGEAGLIAAKTVYFFSTSLMCFCWFIYFEHIRGSLFVNSKKKVLASSCLVWIMGVLLLVNLFTGIFFYVEDGVYRRGTWFVLQYLLAYVYVFGASGHAMAGINKKENLSQKKLLTSLALFPIAPAGAGIIQFIFPQLPVACAALSFATLILYQNWVDDMISVDPLTRLSNRKQLAFHYEQWQRRDEPTALYLLLVDADRFKEINDKYGHTQGDAALVMIADTLRIACEGMHYKANIARYGGDEFVILVRADIIEEIKQIKKRVYRNLADITARSELPYNLSVSIGITKVDKRKSLKEAIEKADTAMYEEKKKRSKR